MRRNLKGPHQGKEKGIAITQINRFSTLLGILPPVIALSPNERVDILRSGLGRDKSSDLVQIQVDAYIFTLE